MMKRILVLGAGEGQISLILRAKEAGWYVIVVSPKGNYPGFEVSDECIYADISDKEHILTIAEKYSIDAIATDQTDVSIPTVQYISEKLNLPHIHCKDIDNFRLKSRMRCICQQSRIPTIPYCVTSSYDTALSFYNNLPSQAIIKPIDSQGSRGVHLISSEEDFNRGFKDALEYSKSGFIIIEKFIKGHEIEVDTVIHNGKICATMIGDVYNFDVKDTFSAYERIYPSSLDNVTLQNINARNEQIVHSLGLETGWSHGEYIISSDGEIYLLEIGARGGGNYIGSDIIKIMCGIGTDEMAFRTAIGDTSFYFDVYPRDCFCAYKCFYLPAGEVSSINISEDFYTKKYVVKHNLNRIFVGMKTLPNTDKTSRFSVVVKADTRELLRHYMEEIEQLINIVVINNIGNELNIIWK